MTDDPDWADFESIRPWLEKRHPVLVDAAFGSPLFRYMREHARDPSYVYASKAIRIASMLSFHEAVRFSEETGIVVGFDTSQEKLYPDYGIPNPVPVSEPDWGDLDASRLWLQIQLRYDYGPLSIGSPLYRYMQACQESRHPMSSPTTRLGSMLTIQEWEKFLKAYPSCGHRRFWDTPYLIVLYPEFNNREWPAQGPGRRAPEANAQYPPYWSRSAPLPPLAADQPPAIEQALFSDYYLPHLRRQSPSSGLSDWRERDDEDNASMAGLTNKRQRKRSDLSGGAVMPAKPPNPYEANDGPRHRNDIGSMPPPPRSRPRAAGTNPYPSTTTSSQQRKKEQTSTSSRQNNIDVTRTQSRPPHTLFGTRRNTRVLEPSTDSTGMQIPGIAKQNDRSLGTLLVESSRKRSIRDTEDEYFTSSPSKKRRARPDTSGDGSLVYSPLGETPPSNSTTTSSVEEVEDASPARPSSESRRTLSYSVGNGPPVSSTSTGAPLADPSRKRSIENVEHAPLTNSPPKRQRTLPKYGDDDLLPSSPFDPPERSTPTPSPSLFQTRTKNGKRGNSPSLLRPESLSYEDAATIIFRPNNIAGPAFQPGSQSEATGDGSNSEVRDTDGRPYGRFHHSTLDGGSETQDPNNAGSGPVSQSEPLIKAEEDPSQSDSEMQDPNNAGSGPVSQSETFIKIEEEEDSGHMIMDFEPFRNQRTSPVMQNSGGGQEQRAIGVVIPLQIPQPQPAANQERRKPRGKGGKARHTEPQGKRKPQTRSGQQAYVGRLRSGVGGRKHKSSKYFISQSSSLPKSDHGPGLVFLEFEGRKVAQAKAN